LRIRAFGSRNRIDDLVAQFSEERRLRNWRSWSVHPADNTAPCPHKWLDGVAQFGEERGLYRCRFQPWD
jgi:hypothetical protein